MKKIKISPKLIKNYLIKSDLGMVFLTLLKRKVKLLLEKIIRKKINIFFSKEKIDQKRIIETQLKQINLKVHF